MAALIPVVEPWAIFALIALYIWVFRSIYRDSWALILVPILASHALRREKPSSLGFQLNNFRQCLSSVLPVLMVFAAVLMLAGITMGTVRNVTLSRALLAFLGYCPWGLFQQYLLNGYFVNRFLNNTPLALVPLLSCLLFSGAHFPNLFLMPVTLVGGYCCARVYLKHRNLYVVGLAHSLIGFLLFMVVPDSVSHHLSVGPALLKRMVVAASSPEITAVVNGASFEPGIAAEGWLTIRGTCLSSVTHTGDQADLRDGKLPATLNGVSVTINGRQASLSYVSPGQINALAPYDAATGPVLVQVITPKGSSRPFTIQKRRFAPALFQSAQGRIAASRGNGIPVTAVHAGELIDIYGTGFGPATSRSIAPVTVKIGGLPASLSSARLAGPGLYQLKIVVPSGLSGNVPIVAEIAGASTQPGLSIQVEP